MERKNNQVSSGMIKGQVIALAIGLGVLLLGTVLVTWLILEETITIELSGVCRLIVQLLAGLSGGVFVSKYYENNVLIRVLIFIGIYILLDLAACILFCSGITKDFWGSMGAAVLGAGISIVFSVFPKKRKRVKKYDMVKLYKKTSTGK